MIRVEKLDCYMFLDCYMGFSAKSEDMYTNGAAKPLNPKP